VTIAVLPFFLVVRAGRRVRMALGNRVWLSLLCQ
jgi:hypothetical protein